jgi:hypothetical protein
MIGRELLPRRHAGGDGRHHAIDDIARGLLQRELLLRLDEGHVSAP